MNLLNAFRGSFLKDRKRGVGGGVQLSAVDVLDLFLNVDSSGLWG